MTERACKNCDFWREGFWSNTWHDSECRFDPPKLIMINEELKSVYPSTTADGWCGKFEFRDDL